ncbi:MAG TPA: acetylornithine deacetylase, partial [Brevundimonas sp.]|nr:acetylornithine deacetylase [Brevundimonas sp.]
ARVGWTVLLSPDEEIGSPASAPLLAELGARGHVGLTYEPALSDGTLAGERKGSG